VKVLLYIIRRTFGFKKDQDNISLSQMLNGIVKKNGERLDSGTGLIKPSLCPDCRRSLTALGDEHSKAFYRLVARKVPETVIRRMLSEVKQGGADSSAKVFTMKIMGYAQEKVATANGAPLAAERKALADHLTGHLGMGEGTGRVASCTNSAQNPRSSGEAPDAWYRRHGAVWWRVPGS
jgi:hypothetical protein